MSARRLLPALVALALANALPSVVRADEPPPRTFSGTFRDNELTLVLALGDDAQSYTGRIESKGKVYNIEQSGVKGGQLWGSFAAGGQSFDFFASWKNNRLEFSSGKSQRTLEPDAPFMLGDIQVEPDKDVIFAASDAVKAKDYAKAWALLKPLFAKGNARAFLQAGILCEDGQGVPQDYVKAMYYYRRAGAAGMSAGFHDLALLVQEGHGCEKNVPASLELFSDALRMGNSGSALSMGVIYVNGDPAVPRDLIRGYAFYLISGNEKALSNKKELDAIMKPEDIAKAQALADDLRREYFPQSNKAAANAIAPPIVFERKPDGTFVVSVKPTASSFEKLEPGDVLIAVDQKPVKNMDEAGLKKLLMGAPDSMIQLELKRGDRSMQYVCPRSGE